jgi:aminoglycoside 2'-N-acetyltransferase I
MIQLLVAHTADLDPDTLDRARDLLFEVFDDMHQTDWDHCLGGMHAVLVDRSHVVGHASLIQRWLVNDGVALRTGYVEGVAVRQDQRGRGLGGDLMTAIERLLRGAFDVGALGSTDDAIGFYEHRGWVRWPGPTWSLTPTGAVRTEDDDGGVFVLPLGADLEFDADLTCDWRPGDAW